MVLHSSKTDANVTTLRLEWRRFHRGVRFAKIDYRWSTGRNRREDTMRVGNAFSERRHVGDSWDIRFVKAIGGQEICRFRSQQVHFFRRPWTVIQCFAALVNVLAQDDTGGACHGHRHGLTLLDGTAEVGKLRADMTAIFDKREEKARNDGNKKLLDEIKFQRKLFDDEEEWPADTPANLNKRLTKAKADVDAAMVSAIKECVKAKKDDDAAAVEKDLIEFRKDVFWPALDLATAKVEIKEGFIRMPANTRIASRKTYKGAIDITVVVRTASEDIRLNAHRGSCVIFNWPDNASELRITRPDRNEESLESGTLATAKVTPLKPNTYYVLTWRLTPDGMAVFENGQRVFFEQKQYDLNTETKIGIGVKSPVDIKEFKVTRLFTGK